TTRHKHWVEGENDRAQIATNITDILLQETKRNIHKIFKSSENALVDVVKRLIEASIYQMPIDFDIEVTRNERQSDASKNEKIDNGKWLSTGTKTHHDHNKLARFCLDGYTDMSKKSKKDELYKFCIVFADHCVDVYGLLREK
ncbi:11045_t:CDS:2, partial [Racocetra persica]